MHAEPPVEAQTLAMHLPIVVLILIQSFYASACPEGWDNFESRKCFSYHPVAKVYDEAVGLCNELHAKLASIHSYEEQEFLEVLAKRHTRLSGVHWAWVGATRQHHSEGTNFTWADGTPLNYTRWRSGCPDNREDENCVLMTVFKDRSSHWCNFKCDSNHDHVICERPYPGIVPGEKVESTASSYQPRAKGTVGTSLVTTEKYIETTTDAACPLGWSHFETKCFILHDNNVTFSEAPHICKHRYNAKMVSVHSEEEQTFLVEQMFFISGAKEAVWLGGKRKADNSTEWNWLDKSPFNYTSWGYNEPDNRHLAGPENCLVLNDIKPNFGKWIDVPCHMEFLLICEKPANLTYSGSSFVNHVAPFEVYGEYTRSTDAPSKSSSHPALIMLIISLLFIIAILSIVVYMLQQKLKRSSNLYCSTLNFTNSSYDASRNLVAAAEPPYGEEHYAEITYSNRPPKDPFSN